MRRVRFRSAPQLLEVAEGGEYLRGSFGTTKEMISIKEYGRTLGYTREALINDNLGMFTRMIELFAAGAADIGAAVEVVTSGVFDLAKVNTQVWASVGLPIYWDARAALVTTTGAGNTLLGVNLATAANPSATGRVRLNGSFT